MRHPLQIARSTWLTDWSQARGGIAGGDRIRQQIGCGLLPDNWAGVTSLRLAVIFAAFCKTGRPCAGSAALAVTKPQRLATAGRTDRQSLDSIPSSPGDRFTRSHDAHTASRDPRSAAQSAPCRA